MRQAAVDASRGFTQAGIDELERALLELTGEPLRDAVRELIFLGALIEESGRDAAPLFAMLESRPILRALDRANATRIAEQSDRAAHYAKQRARWDRSARPPVKAENEMRLSDLGACRFAGLKLR